MAEPRGAVNKARTLSLINILCTRVVFSLLVPSLKLSMGLAALVYVGFSALDVAVQPQRL